MADFDKHGKLIGYTPTSKPAPEKTPYQQLQRALLDAGAQRIREERIDTVSPSRLEFWTVPTPSPGRLVIVQVWQRGKGRDAVDWSWDAYTPLRQHVTERAIDELLNDPMTAALEKILRLTNGNDMIPVARAALEVL
jgi:hypothetical protein